MEYTKPVIATQISKSRSIDLHRYNIMMRGDVIVITDPVFDRNAF
jgi:phage terminase large subunit